MGTGKKRGWFNQLAGTEQKGDMNNLQNCHVTDYELPHELISIHAIKVLQRLNDHGYKAYLVGGCIRDLLLDIKPKDFDIATDAHPEEVRRLFRNSRIIGRRFKLIHIIFGREIIEVATFRAHHMSADTHAHHVQDGHSGRILRDNVYGTIEEDAARRDFTINALYYSHQERQLVDFSTGLSDLDARLLRLLGDPEQRYREDPVRMLRAIRFCAKLNLTLAPETGQPINKLTQLLSGVPAARLFDEILKLFLNGKGENALHLLLEYQLFSQLFPVTCSDRSQQDETIALLGHALNSTDKRVAQSLPVTPEFICAALLWPSVASRMEHLVEKGVDNALAMEQAADDIISSQCRTVAIPKRFTFSMREIWELQPELVCHDVNKIAAVTRHPRFRAAYDFLPTARKRKKW